jgi:uncharacterized protein
VEHVTELPIVGTAPAEWPTRAVVDEALADPSWRPLPFCEFTLKLHGRCNLACDYCYMYEMVDQSWRQKPMVMDRATIDQVAARVGEHLRAHAGEVPRATVRLHGGEALLAGTELVSHAGAAFRRVAPPGTELSLRVQTNGVLLDDAMLAVLREHDIRVGVSLDGGRQAHDRHRRYANGRGSYDAVLRGIEALRRPPYADLYDLLLCTIDVANDPIEVYEALLTVAPAQLDFEMPVGNWEHPPPGWTGDRGGTSVADWLIPIFDRWYASSPLPTSIRLFDSIMGLVLGGHSHCEVVGLDRFQSIIIESDGTLEFGDTLKAAYPGAPVTGYDVVRTSFDEVRLLPGVVARQRGAASLCGTCRACPVRDICGAGEYSTRYRAGTGFLNPSVYCADLTKLIRHIQDRVLADVRALAG